MVADEKSKKRTRIAVSGGVSVTIRCDNLVVHAHWNWISIALIEAETLQ